MTRGARVLGSVIGMQEWCGVERRVMRGVNPSGVCQASGKRTMMGLAEDIMALCPILSLELIWARYGI
jgi:hypothetical protein